MEKAKGLKVRAMGDRVIIEPLTVGPKTVRIILPQNIKRDTMHYGKVIAIGERVLKNGTRVPSVEGIEIGDTVFYTRAGGWDMQIDGRDVCIINGGYVMAKVEKLEESSSQ